MLTLYYSPGACSLAVHIALIEYKIQFQLKRVDLATHKTEDGIDFTTINPKGYVPVIVFDDGEILTEATAILFYIAEQDPDSLIKNLQGLQRYKLLEWVAFVSTEMHKTFSTFFNKKLPEESRVAARERFSKRLDLLEQNLKSTKYLTGDQFTVADAYCFVILRWLKFVNTGLSIESWPNVNAYYSRLTQQDAILKAVAAEEIKV